MTTPTYPGPNTYPGAVYPGSTPLPTGSNQLDLTSTLVPLFVTVERGAGALDLTTTVVVSFDNPGEGSSFLDLTTTVDVSFVGNGVISTDPSITATPEPDNVPPRLRIEFVNIGGTSAQVVRINPDGSSVPVRTADPAPLNGGGWIGYDYEAPFNAPVTYEVIPSQGASGAVFSPAVQLTVPGPWLAHPGIPDFSQPVQILDFGDETKTSSAGVHQIMGRATPIVITDGRRKASTFTMTVVTTTEAQAEAMDDLLYDTTPLLLQVVQGGVARAIYRWVAVGDVAVSQSGQPFASSWREWTLTCTTVDRPVGALLAQRTYADVLAEAASYDELAGLYSTLRGVLTGIGGD